MKKRRFNKALRVVFGSLALGCLLFSLLPINNTIQTSLNSNQQELSLDKKYMNDYVDGAHFDFKVNRPDVRVASITTDDLSEYVPIEMYWENYDFPHYADQIYYDAITSTEEEIYNGIVNAPGWTMEGWDSGITLTMTATGFHLYETARAAEEFKCKPEWVNHSVAEITENQVIEYILQNASTFITDLPVNFQVGTDIYGFNIEDNIQESSKNISFTLKGYVDENHNYNSGTINISFKMTGFAESKTTTILDTYDVTGIWQEKIATEISQAEVEQWFKKNYQLVLKDTPIGFDPERNIQNFSISEVNNNEGSMKINFSTNKYFNEIGQLIEDKEKQFSTKLTNIHISQTLNLMDKKKWNVKSIWPDLATGQVTDEMILEYIRGHVNEFFYSLPYEFNPETEIHTVNTITEAADTGTKTFTITLSRAIRRDPEYGKDNIIRNQLMTINAEGFLITFNTLPNPIHDYDANRSSFFNQMFTNRTLNEISQAELKTFIFKNISVFFSNPPKELTEDNLVTEFSAFRPADGIFTVKMKLNKITINGAYINQELPLKYSVIIGGFKKQPPTNFNNVIVELDSQQAFPSDLSIFKDKVLEFVNNRRDLLNIPEKANITVGTASAARDKIIYQLSTNMYFDRFGLLQEREYRWSATVGPFLSEENLVRNKEDTNKIIIGISICAGIILLLIIMIIIIVKVRHKRKDKKYSAKVKSTYAEDFDKYTAKQLDYRQGEKVTYYSAVSNTTNGSTTRKPTREELEREMKNRGPSNKFISKTTTTQRSSKLSSSTNSSSPTRPSSSLSNAVQRTVPTTTSTTSSTTTRNTTITTKR